MFLKVYNVLIMYIMVSTSAAYAHEWTPTYPKLSTSYVPNVLVLDMELFNSRKDIGHYEIEVLDKDFNPVPFATADKIIPIEYTERKNIEIYIRRSDRSKATYVCSKSKIITSKSAVSLVASRICSKIVG